MEVFPHFIEDRCVEGPQQWASAEGLHSAYEEWSAANGVKRQ
jgi:hypothetical protein